jgi:predicted transposase YdaD
VPPEIWLAGGLGPVPLAPLGDVQPAQLPAVIAQMKHRLDRERPSTQAELWSAAYILMGMRYEQALIQALLEGVIAMKESVTYQAILREGEANEARKILLLLGRDQFGEPSADVQAALNALADVNRIEELTLRLKHVASWQELLGLPAPRRRSPRKKPSGG